MADDILNQDEIESLLSSMETAVPMPTNIGNVPTTGAVPPTANVYGPSVVAKAGADQKIAPRQRERVIPYDFKRPERVGKEQMRALQTLHEGFGRNFGAALSALLRSIVEVKLTSVDQLTYSEFVFSLENPTCFNLLRAEPLEGHLILDINPSILYPIIDRLLGGGKDSAGVARRPLTEIELRLVGRITGLFLEEMRRAWENVAKLELSVTRVESNPQLVQIVPPNEVVVLIGFEVMMGEVRGMMNLCIPFNSIERIGNKLSSDNWVAYGRRGVTNESMQQIGDHLRDALVNVVVELAESRITTGDLLTLNVGDIITTEKDIRSPLSVCIEGVPKFHARAGAFKGRKAICIERTIPAPSPLGKNTK